MENNNTHRNHTGFFSMLYRTRILITKGESTILNLSVLFSVILLLCAPWLVVVGAIVALMLGYRFAIERNAAAFDKDFSNVVHDAANNVRQAVENVTGTHEGGSQGGNNAGNGPDAGAQM